jgi:tetratricopeptide (TPR) repeat protein
MISSDITVLAKKLSIEFGFKSSTLNPITLYFFKNYYHFICQNDQKNALKPIRKIFKLDRKLALYLTAQMLFLKGKFTFCLSFLDQLLTLDPSHTSAIYLKVKCLECLNQKNKAIDELIRCTNNSNRKKTWLIWANILTTQQDFSIYQKHWLNKNGNTNDWDLINYLITAGLRTQQYDQTLDLLEQSYQKIKQGQIQIKVSSKFSSIPQSNAELALSQIKKVFKKNQIEFFLISGTLLGLIRENKILGHDKDLDIGIWDCHNIDDIKKLIERSGTFEILPIRSPKVLRVRHFSSVCIDIFIHEIKDEKVFHGGVKSIWENSKFDLIPAQFLNGTYQIPENYDLYLTENYGEDWKIPKIEFDSSIDTPNVKITNPYEMTAYCYQKLFISYSQKNQAQCEMYLNQITYYKKQFLSH